MLSSLVKHRSILKTPFTGTRPVKNTICMRCGGINNLMVYLCVNCPTILVETVEQTISVYYILLPKDHASNLIWCQDLPRFGSKVRFKLEDP